MNYINGPFPKEVSSKCDENVVHYRAGGETRDGADRNIWRHRQGIQIKGAADWLCYCSLFSAVTPYLLDVVSGICR